MEKPIKSPGCIFIKDGIRVEKNVVMWSEYLKITTDSLISYHTFIASPFCKDGYKEEMYKEIEKRGVWKNGMMGIICRENMLINETLYCLAFARAYRKVYEREVPDRYADINLSIEEFLNMVDEETGVVLAELQKKYGITSVMLSSDIVPLLINEGFKPQA